MRLNCERAVICNCIWFSKLQRPKRGGTTGAVLATQGQATFLAATVLAVPGALRHITTQRIPAPTHGLQAPTDRPHGRGAWHNGVSTGNTWDAAAAVAALLMKTQNAQLWHAPAAAPDGCGVLLLCCLELWLCSITAARPWWYPC